MSLDDERVRFYFRHREQIETWAALRAEAAASVDEWMTQLAPDMEQLARVLGDDVQLRTATDQDLPYPAYRFVRSSWTFAELSDPPASVALEWVRGRTTMRGNLTPYVGVRSAKTNALGAALRVDDSFRAAARARKDASSAWWPAYAYVTPPGDFPVSADAYRDVIVAAVRDAWHAYSQYIDAAVRNETHGGV